MVRVRITAGGRTRISEQDIGTSLLDILKREGFSIYAPCGGKGTCGKCRVRIKGEGEIISCSYYPDRDIEVILPEKDEANILVHQTQYLEEMPLDRGISSSGNNLYLGVAIDVGTTTVVLYFLDLVTGQITGISSFLNPQQVYGTDVISRINYCQERSDGLRILQKTIIDAVNSELDRYRCTGPVIPANYEKIVIVGNTTMLHIFLGEDPVSIALAPFKPLFTDRQVRKGVTTGLAVNPGAEVVTIPCVSAFVGADILAGLAVMKNLYSKYLFLDIGTNGEMALVREDVILSCATAAGPAFEGSNISCGMGAVSGAISAFSAPGELKVIGDVKPAGICGSGIIDIVAWLLRNDLLDETGLLKETCVIDRVNGISITQQDIREVQLAKSAIISGIRILMEMAELSFKDIDIVYLAGGFGNYINVGSAIEIGLLPCQLQGRIFPVGNSAGIGALQYLKSSVFRKKLNNTLARIEYVELSEISEFATEFAMNMNFAKCS